MLSITRPPPHPLVAASILSADFGWMVRDCQAALHAGADLLHVDVMDGHFVPNLTMGVDMIRALRKHLPDVYLDVHLMVEDPGQYVDMFAQAGANSFSFHLEVCDVCRPGGIDAGAMIRRIRDRGMNAGLVVNPPTAIAPIEPYLDQVQIVLVMSVNPGQSGQAFMPEVLSKAQWVKPRLLPGTRLEIDGGISPVTAGAAVAAGCDMLVSASAVFGATDRAGVIRALHEA